MSELKWVSMPKGYWDLVSPDGRSYLTASGWTRYTDENPIDGVGYWAGDDEEKARTFARRLAHAGEVPAKELPDVPEYPPDLEEKLDRWREKLGHRADYANDIAEAFSSWAFRAGWRAIEAAKDAIGGGK